MGTFWTVGGMEPLLASASHRLCAVINAIAVGKSTSPAKASRSSKASESPESSESQYQEEIGRALQGCRR